MAKAGHAKRISTNDQRKKELIANFKVGALVTTKKGYSVNVSGYWGDRCIVGTDGIIYNVESDFNFKFEYNQLFHNGKKPTPTQC